MAPQNGLNNWKLVRGRLPCSPREGPSCLFLLLVAQLWQCHSSLCLRLRMVPSPLVPPLSVKTLVTLEGHPPTPTNPICNDCFQLKPHSEVLGVKTAACLFGGQNSLCSRDAIRCQRTLPPVQHMRLQGKISRLFLRFTFAYRPGCRLCSAQLRLSSPHVPTQGEPGLTRAVVL